jgi:hypothetical protein
MEPDSSSISKKKVIAVVLFPFFAIGFVTTTMVVFECKSMSNRVLNPSGCVEIQTIEACACGLQETVVSTKTDCSSVGPAGGFVSEDHY